MLTDKDHTESISHDFHTEEEDQEIDFKDMTLDQQRKYVREKMRNSPSMLLKNPEIAQVFDRSKARAE